MSDTTLPVTSMILTHRVDAALEAALESMAWCRELLVIDTTPGGNWSHVRYRFPHLKVISLPGKVRDFAAVRNRAQRQATQPWVLWLDSDEVLPTQAKQVFQKMIANQHAMGWSFKRVDIFHGQIVQWGELRNQWLHRFGQKRFLRWFGAVHEVAAVNGPSQRSSLVIQHSAHRDVASFWEKISHYAKLEAQERVRNNQPWSLWQTLLFPPGKWVFNMIVRQAWRDGWRGVVYATIMSVHSLAVRVYWWELQRGKK